MDRFPRKECVGILNPTIFAHWFSPKKIESPSPPSWFFVSTASIPRGHPLPANSPKNILGAAAARASCDGKKDWPFIGGILGLGFAPISRYDSLENESSSEIDLKFSWWILFSNVSICRSFWEKSSFVEGILVEARGNHHQSLTSYCLYQSRCYSHF